MDIDYLKVFNNLPENIRDAILSKDTALKIKAACLSQGIKEAETSLVAELVGDVLMGVIQEPVLTQKFIEEAHISPEISKNVADTIHKEIINPLKSGVSINSLNPTEMPPTLPYEQAPFKPAFVKDESLEFIRTAKSPESPTPSVNSTPLPSSPPSVTNQTQASLPKETSILEPQHGAPFILHSETEVEPMKETSSQPLSERPIFYKPTFSEEYKKSVLEEKAARIELGEETEKKKQPESFKTSIKEARIVHYSEFRTPLGPFENQNIQEPDQIMLKKEPQTTQSKTSEVHPNNVVDLKDLPLK